MNTGSCIQTIELLRRLALNVHGVIDAVDDRNCDEIISLLKEQEPVKPEQEQKPPRGVKPYYIAAWQRIGELIEAIERQYESADGDARLVEKWANEIGWQASMIEALRGEQDE